MFFRNITSLICISLAAVMATVHSDPLSVTESTTMAATSEVQESAAGNLAHLLDAGDDAVVTLLAGETRLAAHRAVLEARCPVFNLTFAQKSGDQFMVTDMEGPVLRHLVVYCYTLQAPQLPEIALQLLPAAATYGLSDLKHACEQQIARQLTVENAVEAGVLAVRHSCSTLEEAAVAFLKAHIHEVVTTQSWYAIKRAHPHDLLDLSLLLLDSPSETGTPATITSGSHRQPHSDHSSRAPATAATHTPAPDDNGFSRFQSLSQQEKSRRLFEAAKQGAVPEVRALLAAGADVRAREEGGYSWTALHLATQMGHEEAARCLLEGGAEVDARDSRQRTPLHWTAGWGHTAVVRLLLAASADPNARGQWGWTPLHWAAESGRADAAAALLEAGADREARDNDGKTPLDIARQYNLQQLVQMLT